MKITISELVEKNRQFLDGKTLVNDKNESFFGKVFCLIFNGGKFVHGVKHNDGDHEQRLEMYREETFK